MKNYTLKNLKEFVNKLSDEELKQELFVLSESCEESSTVSGIKISDCNYYWNGDCMVIDQKEYDAMHEEDQEDWELYFKKGIPLLRF